MLLFDLFEARKPGVEYKNKVMKGVIERVTVELEGNESSVFSRAAKRYKQMDRLLDAIQEKRNELNGQIKDKVLEYFDGAADEIYTRVIDTVSMTATVSKQQADTPASQETVVDYEAVVKKLLEMVPDLEGKANELIKEFSSIKHTAAKPGKSPSLSVKFKDEDDKKKKLKGKLDDMLDEGLSDVWMAMKRKAKAILDSFKSWGKDYDKKLANVEKMLNGKPVNESDAFAKPIKAKTIVKKLRDSDMDEVQTEAIVKAMEGIDGDEAIDAKRLQQVAKIAKVNYEDVIQAIGLNESLVEAKVTHEPFEGKLGIKATPGGKSTAPNLSWRPSSNPFIVRNSERTAEDKSAAKEYLKNLEADNAAFKKYMEDKMDPYRKDKEKMLANADRMLEICKAYDQSVNEFNKLILKMNALADKGDLDKFSEELRELQSLFSKHRENSRVSKTKQLLPEYITPARTLVAQGYEHMMISRDKAEAWLKRERMSPTKRAAADKASLRMKMMWM